MKLTETQASEWEDLRSRLRVDDSLDKNFTHMDDEIKTDIFSCKHCLLHHSILTLSVQTTSSIATVVHMFLLNDFCLITTSENSSSLGERELAREYVIKYALPLDEVTFSEMFICTGSIDSKGKAMLKPDELSFRLVHNDVYYNLKAGSREERNKWIDELRLGIFSIYVEAPKEPSIGWPFHVENSSYLASAFFGDDNLCRYYLNKEKSLVNTTFSCGMCALHWAAFNDKRNIVKILLDEYGANVDIVNNANNTALHLAAAKGHAAVVQMLLDHQARYFYKLYSFIHSIS